MVLRTNRLAAGMQIDLHPGQVHIWKALLTATESDFQFLLNILSSDERERARKFHFEKDMKHYVVARGILRLLLGNYLHKNPELIKFFFNRYGKPYLSTGQNPLSLSFNLSHSKGLALFAFVIGKEIGVDVEYIRSDLEYEKLAHRFFSKKEVSALATLPDDQKKRAFFNCWTRKEAFIKAKGMGLSLGLDQFDITLLPNEPVKLLNVKNAPSEKDQWILVDLPVSDNFAAALTVGKHDFDLTYRTWNGVANFYENSDVKESKLLVL